MRSKCFRIIQHEPSQSQQHENKVTKIISVRGSEPYLKMTNIYDLSIDMNAFKVISLRCDY